MTVRIALIGAGPWGRNYIKTLAQSPLIEEARLTVLCSSNSDAANWVPNDCSVVSKWEDLFENHRSSFDAVIIATPPQVHAEMAKLAIERSIPCMIEKPLTLEVAEAKSLQKELALRPHLTVLVNHIHLFSAGFEALKTRVSDPTLIREIHSEGGGMGPFRNYSSLWDYGPHDLSMILSLMGATPMRVRARQTETSSGLLDEQKDGANFEIQLEFSGGRSASIRVGSLFEKKTRKLTILMGNQNFILDDLASDKLTLDSKSIPLETGFPLSRAVQTFVRQIQKTKTSDPRFGLDLPVRVVDVLAECQRQLATPRGFW
jgi:predicted dehydrogenase